MQEMKEVEVTPCGEKIVNPCFLCGNKVYIDQCAGLYNGCTELGCPKSGILGNCGHEDCPNY